MAGCSFAYKSIEQFENYLAVIARKKQKREFESFIEFNKLLRSGKD
jgi:hypothetical protein